MQGPRPPSPEEKAEDEVPFAGIVARAKQDRSACSADSESVSRMLTFESMLDLLPKDFGAPAIGGVTSRQSTAHHRLYHFLKYEIDLQAFGITQGQRVAVAVPNGPELAVCVTAILAWAACVPVNPQNTQEEIAAEMRATRAQCVICQDDSMSGRDGVMRAAESLNIMVLLLTPSETETGLFSLRREGPPTHWSAVRQKNSSSTLAPSCRNEVVLLLHTSGTSGTKKIVPHTLEALMVGAGCIVLSWALTSEDVALNMMPLFHIGGLVRNLLAVLLSGGSVVCASGFDPVQFWDLQGPSGPTWYYAGPTMHHMILDEAARRNPLPAHRLRMICNAAGGLPPSLAESLVQQFGAVVLPSYGMTECMPITCPPQDYKLDKTGTSGVTCGPEIRMVDGDGADVPAGTIGGICVRGVHVMKGYEENETANLEAFLPGGWFCTGDMGYVDSEGWLFITGRSKEVINRGGEIIPPIEVEEALNTHPAVVSSIAFSMPHNTLQEVVGAGLVCTPDGRRPDIAGLQAFLRERLHPSKWPQVLVFMPELPQAMGGKVRRVNFAQRCKLPEISDAVAKVDRLWEVDPNFKLAGTPVTTPIPCTQVQLSLACVESALRSSPLVKDVYVTRRQGEEKPVVGYLVLNGSSVPRSAPEELWKFVEQNLHGYELPGALVPVEKVLQEITELSPPRSHHRRGGDYVAPRTSLEHDVQQMWQAVLRISNSEELSVEADFFEIGGTSLVAGQLAARMRRQFKVSLSVRDLFMHRSVATMAEHIATMQEMEVAQLARSRGPENMDRYNSEPPNGDGDGQEPLIPMSGNVSAMEPRSSTAPWVLVWQLLPLTVLHPLRRIGLWVSWANLFVGLRDLEPPIAEGQRFYVFVISLALMKWVEHLLLPWVVILAKWIIVGRYREGRYALWGHMYLRWWLVNQIFSLCGTGIFGDHSVLLRWFYILLGAKIGKNTTMTRHALLREYDLIEIGANATLDHCMCSPFALDRGSMILRKVKVGQGVALCCKTVIAPGHVVPDDMALGPLSSSYEMLGANWQSHAFCRQRFPEPGPLLKWCVGKPIIFSVRIVSMAPWLTVLYYMTAEAAVEGWYEHLTDLHSLVVWFTEPWRVIYIIALRAVMRTISPVVNLLMCILVKRLVIGKFVAGEWSKSDWQIFKRWLFMSLISMKDLNGVAPLVGTHYEAISVIYRILGAKIGRRVYWPGSGLDIVEVDLLSVGDDVVFGSRSTLMPADAYEAKPIRIEDGAMLADRCVVLPGVVIGRNTVLGSGALARKNATYEAGGVFVGSRFGDAVRLEGAGGPSADTGEEEAGGPSSGPTMKAFGRAFYFRQAPYFVLPLCFHIFFNTLWLGLTAMHHAAPLLGALLLLHPFLHVMDPDKAYTPGELLHWMLAFYAGTHLFCSFLSLLVDVLAKWMLLGRRRPGSYSWDRNAYCQRWQLHLVFQQIRQNLAHSGRGVLDCLQGSAFLVWYFRALGATIGKDVCLYPAGADPMMTEPDLVTIGDGCCIDDASLVAHVNTLGEFELNPLCIGAGTTMRAASRILSGAETEEHSVLLEHTLVLAGDVVEAGRAWQGWPSHTSWGAGEDRPQPDLDRLEDPKAKRDAAAELPRPSPRLTKVLHIVSRENSETSSANLRFQTRSLSNHS